MSSNAPPALALSFCAVFAFMTLAWVVSVRLKNASIVDICWGLCFVLQVWVYFALTPEGFTGRKILIGLLVSGVGLTLIAPYFAAQFGPAGRLSLSGFPAALRATALLVDQPVSSFWLQGGLSFIIGLPLLAAQISPTARSVHGPRRDRRGGVGDRVCVRSDRDWQLGSLPIESGQPRAGARSRLVALHPASQLFRRCGAVVGHSISIALAAGGGWSIFSLILDDDACWCACPA